MTCMKVSISYVSPFTTQFSAAIRIDFQSLSYIPKLNGHLKTTGGGHRVERKGKRSP